MPGVHSEQFAGDVGSKVIDPGHARDVGNIVAERCRFDGPFKVVLHGDIEALAGCLVGNDAVHGRVGKNGNLFHLGELLANRLREAVGGIDGIFAGHDRNLVLGVIGGGGALAQTFRDGGGNNLQHGGSDGGGDHVSVGNVGEQCVLVLCRVHAGKTGDGDVLGVLTHLMNGVGIVRVERVNERGRNVGEHKLIARVVQNHPHEPAADVSGAEMEGFHSVTFPKISRISSLVAAFFSCSTDSLRPKILAILDSTFRWDPSAPAIPTTK